MTKPRSLFGINLLAQFVLFLLGAGFAEQMPAGLRELLVLTSTVLFTTFLFGLLYGLFRLLGAHSGGLEWFYQWFPCGMFMESSAATDIPAEPAMPKTESNNNFDWRSLCSFKTLRFVGVLLIITAAFSLFFAIDWQLFQKILVAAILGALCMVGAEWMKHIRKERLPALLSVLGFTLLQFTLTLLSLYAVQQSWPGILQNPNTWLTFKFLLTCAGLFTLWRYRGDLHPQLYFAVAYISPLSLMYAGSMIDFPIGLVFTALLTAIILSYASMHRLASLWVLNTVTANAFVYFLYAYEVQNGGAVGPVGTLALIAFLAFFATHLAVAVMGAQTAQRLDKLEYVHLVLLHVMAALGIYVVRDSFLLLHDYHGFAYVLLGLASFVASFAGGARLTDRLFREMLLNLAIVFSTIGLYVQTQGPWSGVAFLLYACVVLWLSLKTASARTRIYGFIVLGVALFKLYVQFSEIFQSIPGSLAVLGIGVILIALSYKFEALKELVVHGLPPREN